METQLGQLQKLMQTNFGDLFRQGPGFAFFTVGAFVGAAATWLRIDFTGDFTPGMFFALIGTAAFLGAVSAGFFFLDFYLHARSVRELTDLMEKIDQLGQERFMKLVDLLASRPKAYEPTS